jgi:teichuronic acid exporter
MTEKKSFTRRTLEGGAWIGAGSVARLGLRVIAVAVLARLLTPSQYGVAAGAILISEFLTIVYELGLSPTLIQRTKVEGVHVATALFTSLVMAVAVVALTFFSAPLVADLMNIPQLTQVLRVMAFLAPIGALGVICEALLARNMKGKSLGIRRLTSYCVATFVVAIPMAALGFGYWSLVGMQAADTIVDAVMVWFAARHLLPWPRFSRRAFREMLPMSMRFTLNEPLAYVSLNIEKVLISRYLGADALGLYSRASFLTTTAANVFTEITRLSVFPAMAKVKDDQKRLENGILKFLCLAAFLTLPISAFCIVFAKPLILVLLGPGWNSAIGPFAILAAGFYFRLAGRGTGAVFQAVGRPTWLTGVLVFRSVALLVGIWQTEQYGLNAISVVVVVVLGLSYLTMLTLVKLAVGFSARRLAKTQVHPLVISLVIAALGLALERLFPDLPILLLPVLTLLVIAGTGALLMHFDKRLLLGTSNVALFGGAEAGP